MIHCDCSIDYDIASPEFSSSRIVKARQKHRCCECHENISVGKKYEYVSGCWEGEFSTFKTCLRCVALRDKHCSGGFIYGGLFEQLRECMNWDPLTPFPTESTEKEGAISDYR